MKDALGFLYRFNPLAAYLAALYNSRLQQRIASDSSRDVHNSVHNQPSNQQPRRERRGTVLNVSHCVFYKVVAVGFNTLRYDASVGVLNPPHESNALKYTGESMYGS